LTTQSEKYIAAWLIDWWSCWHLLRALANH